MIVRALCVLLLLGTMVTSCGGGSGGSDDVSPVVTPTPTSTATPLPPTPTDTATPAAGVPVAFVAGGHVTLRSDDGGFEWTDPLLPAGNAVDFADRSTGWVVGSSGAGGEIRRTTNGGESWTLQSLELGYPRPTFHDVDAVDRDRAVVAGRETVFVGSTEQSGPPAMFFTRDGGTTWQRSTLIGFSEEEFANVEMRSVCVTAAGHGVAYGSDFTSFTPPALLLVTHDGGATWQRSSAPLSTSLSAKVECAEERNFWVAEESGRLLHSADGGAIWNELGTVLPDPGSVYMRVAAIDFDSASAGRLLAVGNQRLRVLHTTDGGAHWTSQDIVGSTGLFEVYAGMDFDGAHGVVVAQDLHPLSPPRSSFGVAFATADGGATWTETVFTDGINALWDVVLLP